jgi:uncharacterized cupin superfamily protein
MRPVINLDDVPLSDWGRGDAFKARIGSFGELIGSKGIGCMLHVVEPGKKAFPFHVHHQLHELFVILEGEGTYRFGEERYPIRAGDICAAPAGRADVAHQIINTGSSSLKYLGISDWGDTEVIEYPDSKKFAVVSRFDQADPEAGGISYMGRTDTCLDYWDGEE